MIKFKNKFRFTSSSNDSSASSAAQSPDNASSNSSNPKNSSATANSRSSFESRNTISVNNVTEDLSRLSTNNISQHPHTSSGSSPSSSSASVNNSNAENLAVPGLLTVKVYGSSNTSLPIKINNDKPLLGYLASKATEESVSESLRKAIANISDSEEFIEGPVASKYLPTVISIPQKNNETLTSSLLYLSIEFENNTMVIEPSKGTVNASTWNQVVSFDVTKNLSQETHSQFLNLNLFLRLPKKFIPDEEKDNNMFTLTNVSTSDPNDQNKSSRHNESRSNDQANTQQKTTIGDLLVGSIKLPLNLKAHNKAVRLMNHEYLNFKNFNLNTNTGDIMLTIDFKPILKRSLAIDDFDLLKVIGKGSFGKVMQVVKKDTQQIYALKTLRKQHIISRSEVTHTLTERTVLAKINNPFIVPLKFSFQSPEKLYLVLSFINGGELFWHLTRETRFSMDRSRFYIAELLTAIESLHELNVIYRDLKPENILLDYQGHIALCDFGLCKLNMSDDDRTSTFCGTPEYLAPELLLNQGYTRSVDWWTLGILLFEMLTGLPPFYDNDVPTMYRNILQNPLRFPDFLENTDAKDLLVKLLQKDPSKRLSDPIQIKNHKFFKDIDWVKLLNKNYLPPFKPNVASLSDTSNFDPTFTKERPQDSVVDDFLSESMQKQFGGWTYNGDTVL